MEGIVLNVKPFKLSEMSASMALFAVFYFTHNALRITQAKAAKRFL